MGGLKGGELNLFKGSPVSGKYWRELVLKIALATEGLMAITPAVQAPQ